ncbi:developmental pluripotency-associated protein 4-like [Narcine bancroftii]|uniref:developmental pluripotency-associated protein 4-like n=1 Tax=Narcine bancroftii TaxID=1343680 RepID=UPI0038313096
MLEKLSVLNVTKNAELIARLSKVISNPLSCVSDEDEVTSLQVDESDSKDVLGWCVVHGKELISAGWVSLVLKSGQPMVVNRGSLVDFHLRPALMETPPHLEDNKICWECFEKNSVKDSLKQPLPSACRSGLPILIRRQQSLAASRSFSSPDSRVPAKDPISASAQSYSRFGSQRKMLSQFYSQEDEAYAMKVEELLMKISKGDITVDQAVRSERPKVVHSPR